MNRDRWEEICKLNGFAAVGKQVCKSGTVLVAESFCKPKPMSELEEERTSHYKMLWALERDKMEGAMMIRVSAIEHPIQKDRIRQAVAAAESFYG